VNTVGIDLVPVACFGLANFLFEFDSSFVLPTASQALPDLQKVRKANKDKLGRLPLLSLFGHADPVGKDEYNKQLSGRRARAIYGLLRHRASQWQLLMDEPFGGDDWAGRGLLEIARRHT
jgi:ABC-type proline/glycine betaine transport system ATPase subunit